MHSLTSMFGLSMELSVLVAMVHKHHSQASVDSAKSGSEQQLKPSSVELQSTEKQSSKSSAAAADNDESDSLTEEAYLSQLQPGMELRTPVKCADGTLLLASGTELTSQAIEKLTDLRNRGLLNTPAIPSRPAKPSLVASRPGWKLRRKLEFFDKK